MALVPRKRTLREKLDDTGYEEVLIATDFSGKEEYGEACIGISASSPGRPSVAIYDIEKIIEILMKRDGMDYDEAHEHVYYNIVGSWQGDQTPIFIETLLKDEE